MKSNIKRFTRKGREYEYVERLNPEDEDYYYRIAITLYDAPADVIITRYGVSVDFAGGSTLHTNLRPDGMFRGRPALGPKDVKRVLDVLVGSDFEGKLYTAREVYDMASRLYREE